MNERQCTRYFNEYVPEAGPRRLELFVEEKICCCMCEGKIIKMKKKQKKNNRNKPININDSFLRTNYLFSKEKEDQGPTQFPHQKTTMGEWIYVYTFLY